MSAPSAFEAGDAELGELGGVAAAVAVGDERVDEDRTPVIEDLGGRGAQGRIVVGLLCHGACSEAGSRARRSYRWMFAICELLGGDWVPKAARVPNEWRHLRELRVG